MTNPINQEVAATDRRRLAQAIAVNDALAVRADKLRHELHIAEKLHLSDLIKFYKDANGQAQAELEQRRQEKNRLKQQLQKVTQELEECHQELIYTQEDLVNALRSEQITLTQATKVAQSLLAEDEHTREALMRLLNAIYGSTIKPWELQHRSLLHSKPGSSQNSDSFFR